MSESFRTPKSTIKNDPFGTVIPDHRESVVPPEPRVREVPQRREPAPRPQPLAAATTPPPVRAAVGRRKEKLTIHLDEHLANRVRNAAYWNPRLTIARIAERGIRRIIDEVEKENGGSYPQRESELIGGRPMK